MKIEGDFDSREYVMDEALAGWLEGAVEKPGCCFRWTGDALCEAGPMPKTSGYTPFRIEAGDRVRVDLYGASAVAWKPIGKGEHEWGDRKCWHTGLNARKLPDGGRNLKSEVPPERKRGRMPSCGPHQRVL